MSPDDIRDMIAKIEARAGRPIDLRESVEIVSPSVFASLLLQDPIAQTIVDVIANETPAEALARHRADERADFERYELEAAAHPATQDCPDAECDVCAFRDCPHHETMHYHHDGCPACHDPRSIYRLWSEAKAVLEAEPAGMGREIDLESLKLARAGHVNARAIVDDLIPGTCCPCGAHVPCPGVDVNTPGMVRRRDVMTRLRAAMGEA